MDAALIAAHGDNPKLMPSLHLPVQSGSDKVLKAMNRRHRISDYLRVIERIRNARPDIALSSDFIVGFPGEDDDDFEATLALCREVGYAMSYSFAYSARPGTPAAGRTEIEPQRVSDRLQRLQALLAEQQYAFQQSMVGKLMPVLLEKPGREAGQMVGKTPWLHSAHLQAGPELAGSIVNARILRSEKNTLAAEIAAA